jgi:hypothetical protein
MFHCPEQKVQERKIMSKTKLRKAAFKSGLGFLSVVFAPRIDGCDRACPGLGRRNSREGN